MFTSSIGTLIIAGVDSDTVLQRLRTSTVWETLLRGLGRMYRRKFGLISVVSATRPWWGRVSPPRTLGCAHDTGRSWQTG
jgi:hypothetical protein